MGMTRIRNRGEGMQLEIRGATVDVTTSGNTGRGVLRDEQSAAEFCTELTAMIK